MVEERTPEEQFVGEAESARAVRHARPVVCPECWSSQVGKAPRAEYRQIFFLMRRPYKCLACGLLFEAPCSATVCILIALIGAGLVVVALTQEVLPSISALMLGVEAAKALLHLTIGTIGGIGCAWIAFVAIRTARYSRRYRRLVEGVIQGAERGGGTGNRTR